MSQNNAVYDRLKSLYENLNIDISLGNINDAEIYAYNNAINVVRQKIINTINNLFCTDRNSMYLYIDLLNIDDTGKDYKTLLSEIKSKLSMKFGEFRRDLYDKELDEIGPVRYTISPHGLRFHHIDKKTLPKLSKFINNYKLFGDGYWYVDSKVYKTFDEIDSKNADWLYCDGLNLCWDFLEYYKEGF